MNSKIIGAYKKPVSWPRLADYLAQTMVAFVELCDVLLLPIFGIVLVYLLLTTFR